MTRPALIAGVDISSRVIAIVLLDAATGELHATLELAIEPGGIQPNMPQASAFRLASDFIAQAERVWIEDPMGSHPRSVASGSRAVGALIRSLPHRESWIRLVPPPKWKKLAGMKGNASKSVIRSFAYQHILPTPGAVSQDLCDAACIALACWNNTQEKA